jgi:phosphatidate phosphatase APP1
MAIVCNQYVYIKNSLIDIFRYPALRCFFEKYKFPMGTVNLRKFSWSLKFLHPPDTYKNEAISTIIDAYPSRKYICVGDSGLF